MAFFLLTAFEARHGSFDSSTSKKSETNFTRKIVAAKMILLKAECFEFQGAGQGDEGA